MKHSQNVVSEAMKIVREELIADKDLYNAFVASIASALKEIPAGAGLYDAAKIIAARIAGDK